MLCNRPAGPHLYGSAVPTGLGFPRGFWSRVCWTNVRTVETRGAARAQATARDAIQDTLSSGNTATGIFILEGVKE
jgi:hypothetical protein